jgi:hypothetical protein
VNTWSCLSIENKTKPRLSSSSHVIVGREKQNVAPNKVEDNLQAFRGFYLYAIKKDGADLRATKKVPRTCMPSS